MIRTTDSIYIDAPVKKVFDYFKDPMNWTDIAPAWLDVTYDHVKVAPKGTGTKYRFSARMAAVLKMEGAGEFVEVVPNRRIVDREDIGSGPETITYLFEKVGSGTTLTVVDERKELTVERLPLVGRVAEWAVDRLGVQWMHLLKSKMEAAA